MVKKNKVKTIHPQGNTERRVNNRDLCRRSINFVKMTGCGNDFIVIDNRFNKLAGLKISSLVKKVCAPKVSIGADGVLLLQKSRTADIRMRIFNPDGTEVDMCGNGARCLALFAKRCQAVKKDEFSLETNAGILEAKVTGNKVKLKLSRPHSLRFKFDLKIKNKKCQVSYINTGVPHVVYITKNVDKFNVEETGKLIRYHKEFAPAGTNADFVQFGSGNQITLRTYERGVEAETLACGTGSAASAIIASKIKGLSSPITVNVRSGDKLKIYFKAKAGIYTNVYLEGLAEIIFEGTIKV